MNDIVRFDDMHKRANCIVKSGLFGMKNIEQALSLMMLCESEGLHPMQATIQYNIIQNRPALKSDALLARFQNAGGSVSWKTYTDEKVTGSFSHPHGGTVDVTWTMKDAVRAGLDKKENWLKYPRAMLRARCLAEGVRTVFPGVSVGIYTVEEVQDFDTKPSKDSFTQAEDTTKKGNEMDLKKEFEKKLRSCMNMASLKSVWESIPKELRTELNDVKEDVKKIISKPPIDGECSEIDSNAVNLISIQLKTCDSLSSLLDVWEKVPPSMRAPLKAVKDKKQADLEYLNQLDEDIAL